MNIKNEWGLPMDKENESILRQFEQIVNKIYEEKILPKKRQHKICHDDIVDLKMIFGLSMAPTNVIDFDKLLENIKKYG